MRLFDPAHAFFAPLWRRVVIVALCLGWAVLELATGAVFWAILFGTLGLWCLYEFFLSPQARALGHDQEDDQ
ncbi:hypothetical protein J4E08_22995 [Sagittula sp. NFXS13]